MSVFYADTTQKMFLCRKNRKILSTLFLFSIQKVESFVNLNGQIRQKLLKEAKRGVQSRSSLLSPLTNRAGEGKLRQRYLQFICR